MKQCYFPVIFVSDIISYGGHIISCGGLTTCICFLKICFECTFFKMDIFILIVAKILTIHIPSVEGVN